MTTLLVNPFSPVYWLPYICEPNCATSSRMCFTLRLLQRRFDTKYCLICLHPASSFAGPGHSRREQHQRINIQVVSRLPHSLLFSFLQITSDRLPSGKFFIRIMCLFEAHNPKVGFFRSPPVSARHNIHIATYMQSVDGV